MKFHSLFAPFLALTFIFLTLTDVEGGYGGRRRRSDYYPPEPAQPPQSPPNQTDTTKPSEPDQSRQPAAKQEKFKDVPMNTTFYFAADRNKSFPRIKISETTARNVKDGKVSAIPLATVVVVGSETNKAQNTVSPKK